MNSPRQPCCSSKSSSNDQLGDCLLWSLAPELLFSVVTYLDGRGISSLCEALLASKRHLVLFSPLFYHIMCRWQDETIDLLSNKISTPQIALVDFVKDSLVPRSTAAAVVAHDNAPIIIRHVSEWCLLLDYVLEGPRNAASSVSGDDNKSSVDRMVWPIGVGVFVTSTACGLNRPVSTKVIVHCPVWNPSAVMLCHSTWLPSSQTDSDNNKATNPSSTKLVKGSPTHFAWLPSEGDIDGFIPDENIGILTPFDETNERTFRATQALTRNDDFLPAMGRPDSCLTILPAQECEIYGSLVDHFVRSSRHHSWMLGEVNNVFGGRSQVPTMLCFFDNHSKYTENRGQLEGEGSLVDLIMRLMKTCRSR